ncbi:DUF3592 domain-containing protein [Pseudarthrobacter phenanthrenivorans]|uniref:DUF3592 domain-containing protein n=2 Tax=Pseudarthrobacter phenanthrenivorans TaxID=361575 RepID=A0A3B0FE24_PSEPS|nr:DUF3592 domain-containing protein [Pseudarthrobacter phenanthrenivorans]ADX71544.1 hypothetical protein Asphe3_03280 [Pseudarthrobacter phenanthrenivorans Sphe3]RKO21193.1 DUF3592 domain-containing protein [Pseudarthrobacter phenanthrenivorans]TPV48754.1 DUF3592 domain-containing protein [Pseudarthrobacter phenanthrenivorans]
MKIILYIVWALFVVAAVFAVVHAVRKTRHEEQLVASWPKVQATVTGSVAGWTNGGGRSSRRRRFFPTYQFTDPQGTLFAGESEVSSAGKPILGTSLEVAYNPANPNDSRQVSANPRTTLGCAVPFFAVFALASLWFISVFPVD